MNELAAKYTDDFTARRLVARLFEAGKELPDTLHDRLLKADDATARALIALVEDRDLRRRNSPGGGWVPIHATILLGERREPTAVEPLIAVVEQADVEDLIYSRAIFALQEIGEPALEPVVEAIDAGRGPAGGKALAEILCELAVSDERILEILMGVFEEDPQLGASYLASYGDPAALATLHQAFASLQVHANSPFVNHIFTELAAAIEAVGGKLTPDERAKLERATQIRRRIAEVVFGDEAPLELVPDTGSDDELGADEPCWCGSGTKFKNCHGRPDRGAHS